MYRIDNYDQLNKLKDFYFIEKSNIYIYQSKYDNYIVINKNNLIIEYIEIINDKYDGIRNFNNYEIDDFFYIQLEYIDQDVFDLINRLIEEDIIINII